MPEIVIFTDAGFNGPHTHLYETTADFTQLSTDPETPWTWNDVVSSFVVVGGQWELFRDVNFGHSFGVFGPGTYRGVTEVGVDNDSLSSVRLLSE